MSALVPIRTHSSSLGLYLNPHSSERQAHFDIHIEECHAELKSTESDVVISQLKEQSKMGNLFTRESYDVHHEDFDGPHDDETKGYGTSISPPYSQFTAGYPW